MKIRNGFISNSSSTSFVITNLTDETKTLVDLVKETPHLIKDYIKKYESWRKDSIVPDMSAEEIYTQEKLIKSAEENNITFAPSETLYCTFGDEDGTLIGQVYDYMLRGKELNPSVELAKELKKLGDDSPLELLESFFTNLEKENEIEYKDKFSGIDSPSFKVRFDEWRR